MGWTRLTPPPATLRYRPRQDRPPHTRRIPSNVPRARRGATRSPSGRAVLPSPGKSLCRLHSPRKHPKRRRPSSPGFPRVSPGRDHATGDDPGLGVAYHDDGQHIHLLRAQGDEICQGDALRRTVGVPDDTNRGIWGTMLQQHLPNLAELPVTALRTRVVQRDHEVSESGGSHPVLYDLPRGEEIRETHRAVIVPERRAEQRRGRLRRRNAGNDYHVYVA